MPNKTRSSALESRPSSIEKAIDVLFCFDLQRPQLRLVDISLTGALLASDAHGTLANSLTRSRAMMFSSLAAWSTVVLARRRPTIRR